MMQNKILSLTTEIGRRAEQLATILQADEKEVKEELGKMVRQKKLKKKTITLYYATKPPTSRRDKKIERLINRRLTEIRLEPYRKILEAEKCKPSKKPSKTPR